MISYEYREPPIQCERKKEKIGSIVMETIATNADCRIYHLRRPIYDAGRKDLCQWERNAPSYSEREYPALLELIGEQCLGIESLFAPKSYQLWVSRSAAFEWSEIEAVLCPILNSYCEGAA